MAVVSRLEALRKAGFFDMLEKLKKEHEQEIETFTTRFKLWAERTGGSYFKPGCFSFIHFIRKFIMMATKSIEFLDNEKVRPTLVVVLKVDLPVTRSVMAKLDRELSLVRKFVDLFDLYQLKISNNIDGDFVVDRFEKSIGWLNMTNKEKFDYVKSYYFMLAFQAFRITSDDVVHVRREAEEFVEFSKEVDLYPESGRWFYHECIIDTERRFANTLMLLQMIDTRTKHQGICKCILCRKYDEHPAITKTKQLVYTVHE